MDTSFWEIPRMEAQFTYWELAEIRTMTWASIRASVGSKTVLGESANVEILRRNSVSTNLSLSLWLYSPLELGRFISFLILYAVGRTRPTQNINTEQKHTSGIRTGEDGSCLRRRGHCDRRTTNLQRKTQCNSVVKKPHTLLRKGWIMNLPSLSIPSLKKYNRF
jgi:hypothetical protein